MPGRGAEPMCVERLKRERGPSDFLKALGTRVCSFSRLPHEGRRAHVRSRVLNAVLSARDTVMNADEAEQPQFSSEVSTRFLSRPDSKYLKLCEPGSNISAIK